MSVLNKQLYIYYVYYYVSWMIGVDHEGGKNEFGELKTLFDQCVSSLRIIWHINKVGQYVIA